MYNPQPFIPLKPYGHLPDDTIEFLPPRHLWDAPDLPPPDVPAGPVTPNRPDDEGEGLEAALARLLDTPERPPSHDSGGDCPNALGKHRKGADCPRQGRTSGKEKVTWRGVLSFSSVLLTALITGLVSVLGALASYEPLRQLASGATPPEMAELWPLLIYAPWLAATLVILRTRVYRRRATHSWLVVFFFAGVALLLCVVNAPRNPVAITIAGLPPVTVLLCFHQLVRQLDLSQTPVRAARHANTPRGSHRQRGA